MKIESIKTTIIKIENEEIEQTKKELQSLLNEKVDLLTKQLKSSGIPENEAKNRANANVSTTFPKVLEILKQI